MPLSQPFIDAVLAGDGRAVARAISLVEDETPEAAALIGQIYPRTGRAYLIGITGAPGTGKSTLVDALTVDIRRSGLTVGIIAVDPTSPFTGGAILGDRVRMTGHAADAGVYIRSMATRGHLGGLSRATGDVALVLDAAGKDVIIIETVGVGQDEVDIVRTADVSIVVVVPGTGDDVQAIKAGIMEIGDIFVVNKADREGADQAVQAIAANLSLQTSAVGEWKPPVRLALTSCGDRSPGSASTRPNSRPAGAGSGSECGSANCWRVSWCSAWSRRCRQATSTGSPSASRSASSIRIRRSPRLSAM